MATPLLWTYEDVLYRLLAFLKAHPTGPSVDQATLRYCVESAAREIVTARDWQCQLRKWRIPLVANQVTGTLTYQPSGGEYPYLCTLTGATVPSWAADASVRIANGALV